MSFDKGGGGTSFPTVEAPNPFEISQADFLYNRFNQQTPTSNLTFTGPGQQAPPGQTVQFLPGSFTPAAQELFGGGGGKDKGGFAPAPAPAGGGGGGFPAKGGFPGGSSIETGFSGVPNFSSFSGGSFNPLGNVNPATATQTLAPGVLALQNANLTVDANTIADVLNRQGQTEDLPELLTSLDFDAAGPTGDVGNLDPGIDVRANVDTGGFLGLPTDPEQFREDTAAQMFELGAAPLREEFGFQLQQIQADLVNRGIPLDSAQGLRVLGEFEERQGEALRRLSIESTLAAGAEASRGIQDIRGIRGQQFGEGQTQVGLERDLRSQLFGENVQTEGITEQFRSSRLGEQLQQGNISQTARTQVINELASLLGIQQVGAPGLSSFLPSTSTGVVDAFGLNLAGQTTNANNAIAQQGSKKGGLTDMVTGLGMAGITKSDYRLKRNIQKIGKYLQYNWYRFQYLWSNAIEHGVMAQEVRETNPNAVYRHPSGYLMVDYGAL